MPLSPDTASAISKLMRDDLDSWANTWFWALVVSTLIVVAGLICEAPEIFHEVGFGRKTVHKVVVRLRWFWYIRIRKTDLSGWEHICPELVTERSGHRNWIAIWGLIGWLLVAVGVGGEGFAEYWVNDAETDIRAFDKADLAETQRSANSASGASALAFTFSDKSEKASSNALALATGARRETAEAIKQANVLEREIAEENASLESERTKRVQLQRATVQRSITGYSNESLAMLRPFVPIDFRLQYAPGPRREPEFLASQIGAMPQNAGWNWLGSKQAKSGDLADGITVTAYLGPNGETDSSKDAAEALVRWFHQYGIDATFSFAHPIDSRPKTVGILIGLMPAE